MTMDIHSRFQWWIFKMTEMFFILLSSNLMEVFFVYKSIKALNDQTKSVASMLSFQALEKRKRYQSLLMLVVYQTRQYRFLRINL